MYSNSNSPVRLSVLSAVGLLLAGCVGAPVVPDASPTHPANPDAPTSPVPPLRTGLLDPAPSAPPATPAGGEPGHEHQFVQP